MIVTHVLPATLGNLVLVRAIPPETSCELRQRFAGAVGKTPQPKLLDDQKADDLSEKLRGMWPSLRDEMRAIMRPASEIAAALAAAGAPLKYADLGLRREAFADAVRYARAIRNRYTFLDLAADAGLLDVERIVG